MPSARTLSRIKAIVEIPRGERDWRTLHTFRFPNPSETGFYRSIRSLESFSHGSPPKRDAVPWNHPQFPGQFKPPSWRADRMFYCQHHDFAEFLDKAEREYNRSERQGYPMYDERIVPVVHHADLWAFYEHIGWDYKARVYREAA